MYYLYTASERQQQPMSAATVLISGSPVQPTAATPEYAQLLLSRYVHTAVHTAAHTTAHNCSTKHSTVPLLTTDPSMTQSFDTKHDAVTSTK
jgi:hypothetical protein